MQRKHFNALLAGLLATASLGIPVHAQEKPVIKIWVGFPPGGAADSLARLLSDKLRDALGQQVIVENKPGVGGRIAAQAIKAAPPNGQHYMIAPNATFVFQHLTYSVKELGYDMNTDFTPVAQLTSYPMTMVVNSSIHARNAKEYVNWLKSNPSKGNFGTAGAGGDTHFNGLEFSRIAGVPMQVVPYRGNAPLVVDLVGNQIQTGIMPIGDAIQHIRSGKLNPIGIFAARRSSMAPEVPTMAEQGFDTGGTDGWMGMWGPAKLDPKERDRMQAALKQVLELPDVKQSILNNFVQLAEFKSGSEIEKQLKYELGHWGPIIRASGFKPTP